MNKKTSLTPQSSRPEEGKARLFSASFWKRSTNGKKNLTLVFVILIVLLLLGIFLDLNAGYSQIALPDMIGMLFGGGSRALRFNLIELRLPRVLMAVLVGFGLSVSGVILQSVTRNDMADPSVLGLNAGAGLMVALFILFFSGSSTSATWMFPLAAFLGAVLTGLAEFSLATVQGKLQARRLLLMGIAISLALSSLTTLVILKMPDSQYAFIQSWLSGSIWGATWENLAWLFPGLVILVLAALYFGRMLDILHLGEESATGLGVPFARSSAGFILLAAALASLCCAVGGGLAFVGLVCPHIAKRLAGPQTRILVPASLLCGGILLVYSDIIARTLFLPNEIPVGIVTAVIGAPYFLYLLMKER